MRKIVHFTSKDNVAVLLYDMQPGESVSLDGQTICALDEIPYGHKIALCDIAKGGYIYKYGEPVARATEEIRTGQWVHVHNCESIRGLGHR